MVMLLPCSCFLSFLDLLLICRSSSAFSRFAESLNFEWNGNWRCCLFSFSASTTTTIKTRKEPQATQITDSEQTMAKA